MMKPNARSPSITSQESYSAVIITDLIAEIPVSPEIELERTKPTKEATNLAYDGHMDGDSKSHTVDGMDTANSFKSNGGSISRGVILNAVQFGQSDSKTKSDEKAMQLTATLPVPSLTQEISEPKGFKNMSFLRKIAFGFSFLPSIFFVLCFAIILPCNVPKPCVEEVWVKRFNNTEVTSRLEIPHHVMFTALKEGKSVLMELYEDTGDEKKMIKLPTNSAYLTCGKIMNADKTDCIVMDEEGKFYSFNGSHSKVLWDPISETGEQPSSPIILSDCNGDKIKEVAIAVSSTTIKVMYSGTTVSTLTISECDSIPTKLMPWATNGSSDMVFVCEKDGKDVLVKVPQNVWCAHTKNLQEKILLLHSGPVDSIKKSVIQPVEDGLVLWSGDEISMIQPDGSLLWKVSNESHSEKNRFILYGNFDGENKQVALLSSNFSSELRVTLLEISNGTQMKSTSYLHSEATEVVLIQGKKKDFILMLQKKVKSSTDIMTTALTQLNDLSTTIVSFISNEGVNDVTYQPTSEELVFLDLEGKIESVKEIRDLEDAAYKTSMTAVYDEKTDVLRIYLLGTSENNSPVKTTEVRSINVANWDISTTKSTCLAK